MYYESVWSQPDPQALLEPGEPPVPDTESLLSEVGASFPAVAYPAAQESIGDEEEESAVDQTIFAGLVWP
jgi:hypothetical protein